MAVAATISKVGFQNDPPLVAAGMGRFASHLGQVGQLGQRSELPPLGWLTDCEFCAAPQQLHDESPAAQHAVSGSVSGGAPQQFRHSIAASTGATSSTAVVQAAPAV